MERLSINKTYKIFINGEFVRSESGRYFELKNKANKTIANICLSSRKDFKNSVVAARNAAQGWASKSAFNRSQIIYRLAEMLEGKKEQLISELVLQGSTSNAAKLELNKSIDRIVYYAGWCDKYSQLFSTVNPVASPHFNFSIPEPCGVVSIICPKNSGLLALVSIVLPVIVGGNVCVILASEKAALNSISFSEAIATSDFPAGVVNVLTGKTEELHAEFSSHMDVNALIYADKNKAEMQNCMRKCASNVKRFHHWDKNWNLDENQNPYLILDLQEIKTTWHPIDKAFLSNGKY